MFCSKCGSEIAEGAAFCQKCGAKVVYAGDGQQSSDIPMTDVKDRQAGEVVENTQQASSNNAAKVNESLRKASNIGRVLMWGSLVLLMPFWPLRINPAILVSIAAIGMILSVFGPKPLSLSTKIQAVVGVILIAVIIVTSVRSSDGEGDKYVQIVKDGTLDEYPQMTVGKAFDDFLDNPKWESGLSENNERFVNVKGGILYYDKEAEVLIQFIVDEKAGSFQYNACEINGIPQNNLVFWGLLETIYNGGTISTESGSQSGQDSMEETPASSNLGTDEDIYSENGAIEYSEGVYDEFYNNYRDLVSETYLTWGEYATYSIYDIDKDGVEELIVSYGESDADWYNEVWSRDENGIIYFGVFYDPVVLYEADDGNGIYAVSGHQGVQKIDQITKVGNVLYIENIMLGELAPEEEYYSNDNPIDEYSVSDMSILD